jgi:hypothetical protein
VCQAHRHLLAFHYCRRMGLFVPGTGVMNVSDTEHREKERTEMKTFTIDTDNNISAFATQEEAAATTATAIDSFSNQKELAQLAGVWPAERLLAIWNSLPGVKQVKRFRSAKAGVSRIWERIQGLGEPEKPKAERKAKAGAPAAKNAPAEAKRTKKTNAVKAAKNTPQSKAMKVAPAEVYAGPREGSKTAQVVTMLQRRNGASLVEIMEKMGGQKHTARGFMAGAMIGIGAAVTRRPLPHHRTYGSVYGGSRWLRQHFLEQ